MKRLLNFTIISVKLSAILALSAIFVYWSVLAIEKYSSKPVSTSVSFRFGDDNHGNIRFPVVTFCHPFWTTLGKSFAGISVQRQCAKLANLRWPEVLFYFHDCLKNDSTNSITMQELVDEITFSPEIMDFIEIHHNGVPALVSMLQSLTISRSSFLLKLAGE